MSGNNNKHQTNNNQGSNNGAAVAQEEADPTEGRISNESPLGEAMLGAKAGEIVRIKAPRGITEFRVVRIG